MQNTRNAICPFGIVVTLCHAPLCKLHRQWQSAAVIGGESRILLDRGRNRLVGVSGWSVCFNYKCCINKCQYSGINLT